MLDDLALFVEIVQRGSLSAAARHLDLPAATVTRRLQQLETRIGCRLLNRSARRIDLTSEGRLYFEECAELVGMLSQRSRELRASLGTLAGRIRLLAPSNVMQGALQPAFSAFLQRYPEIDLELELSNRLEPLAAMQADLAIRVGPLQDSALSQRRLGEIATVLVAAPGLLARRGTPPDPSRLDDWPLISLAQLPRWSLRHNDGRRLEVTLSHPRLKTNDLSLAARMAVDGIGITLLPATEAAGYLATGALQLVLPQWRGQPRQVSAVWSQGRLLPRRARLLLDWLAQFMEEVPLFQGRVDA